MSLENCCQGFFRLIATRPIPQHIRLSPLQQAKCYIFSRVHLQLPAKSIDFKRLICVSILTAMSFTTISHQTINITQNMNQPELAAVRDEDSIYSATLQVNEFETDQPDWEQNLSQKIKSLEDYNFELESSQEQLKHEINSLRIKTAELEAKSTELNLIRDELESSTTHLQSVFKSAPIGIICADTEGYIEKVNFAGTRILDAPVSVLKHTYLGTYLGEVDNEKLKSFLHKLRQSSVSRELAVTITSHQQRPRKVQLIASSYRVEKSSEHKLQLALIDTSRQQDTEEQLRNAKDYLERLAHHDPLTNLPNRMLFNETLRAALVRARRFHCKIAALFIDIDGFKPINDIHGHVAGDMLLCEIANRLRAQTRDKHTVARMGGDEFTMILENQSDLEGATRVANRISESLRQPISIGELEVFVSASIGICLYPDQAKTPEDLIKGADISMYRAKERGGDRVVAYSKTMSEIDKRRMLIEASIPKAIEEQQFELWFQPMFQISTKTITGVEALIRWNHPDYGLIMPDEFVSLAEQSGKIVEIGNWVLETACKKAAQWSQNGINLRMSVNVSGRQFCIPHLAVQVEELLQQHALPAELLELEITESTAISEAHDVLEVLNNLRNIGVNLAIDDFGTGYSSFARLSELPLSRLKLDRLFIGKLQSENDTSAIVKGLIYMAHELGIEVVAEGVEQSDQLDFLCEHQCDILQGHYLARPLTERALETTLASSAHWPTSH